VPDSRDGVQPPFADRDAQLLAAADVAARPVPVGLPYQIGLVLVAAAMLLLPLLYLALIGLLAFGEWWYAVHAAGVLFGGGGGMWLRALAYFAPLFGGAVGLLFLIKPILARPPARPSPLTLTPEEEPLLHAFVERLCAALRAPAPREIRADLQVNASASFRRGVGSMLTNDLVLTLGLPFVGGLTVTQLAGVLAHEFGHFGQAVAMRLTYLIRSVHHWFARVVYERDRWDEMLETARREHSGGYQQAFIGLAMFFVGLSRRILALLMYVGRVLSAYLSRQMEYHADRYQIQVVGSDGLRETYLRTIVLVTARRSAAEQVDELMAEARLPDDLVALTQVHVERLERDDPGRARLVERSLELRTERFDTHPSDVDRIRAAERLAVAPRMDRPEAAHALFRDFAGLSRRATANLYAVRIGDAMPYFTSITAADAAAVLAGGERAVRAARRLLYGGPIANLGLAPVVPLPEPPEHVADGIAAIRAARSRAAAARPLVAAGLARYDAACERQAGFADALVLVGAGIRYPPDLEAVSTRDVAELIRLERSGREEREAERQALRPVMEPIRERVAAAVALARHAEVRAELADLGAILTRADVIAQTLDALVQHWRHLDELSPSERQLTMLFQSADRHGSEEDFLHELARLTRDTRDTLQLIRRRLGDVPYPFEHAHADASVGEYLLPVEPPDAPGVIEHVERVYAALRTLYRRCWGELALLVETVEAHVGLPELVLTVTQQE